MPPTNKIPLCALLATALALLAVTLPLTATAQPDSFFNVRPDPANQIFALGDTMRICVDDSNTNANDWMQMTWRAYPVQQNTTVMAPGIQMPTDTEGCVTVTNCADAPEHRESFGCGTDGEVVLTNTAGGWGELDECMCLNVTGRWSVRFEPEALTGDRFAYFNFSVVDPTLHPSSSTETSGTTTTSVDGFTTFDTRVPQLLWFGLSLLALWQGWYLSAFVFITAGMATELPDLLPEFTYTWGYVIGLGALVIEVIVYQSGLRERVREAWQNRAGRVGG